MYLDLKFALFSSFVLLLSPVVNQDADAASESWYRLDSCHSIYGSYHCPPPSPISHCETHLTLFAVSSNSVLRHRHLHRLVRGRCCPPCWGADPEEQERGQRQRGAVAAGGSRSSASVGAGPRPGRWIRRLCPAPPTDCGGCPNM